MNKSHGDVFRFNAISGHHLNAWIYDKKKRYAIEITNIVTLSYKCFKCFWDIPHDLIILRTHVHTKRRKHKSRYKKVSKIILENVSWFFFFMCFNVGESRQPWAGVCLAPITCFQKVWKEKTWIFYTKLRKLDSPSLKKIDLIFKRRKYIFCSKFFSIKIGKTEFSFLINGSDNSGKYQRIDFNEFHDKIILANNFT